MSLTYFKRYRMELDLRRRSFPAPLARGYRLLAWTPEAAEDHAEAKYHSFRGELDASLFPCLSSLSGCRRLMEDISKRPGFLPEATWLLEYVGLTHKPEFCGTIQGVRATPRYGGIQNVGVAVHHRGRGLGEALVAASLLGFQQQGLTRAYLEVTAQNANAVRLYRRLGFRKVKTLYKAVELAYS